MAQLPKLMARLQFGLQFNTVPRRPGQTDQGRWSSLNRSGQRRPELLMRLGLACRHQGRSLSQFSHGLTGRYRTMASPPDTRQDADLPIRIPAH
jgi:hypothetical protein